MAPPLGLDLVRIEVEFADAGDGLRGEGLVEFDQVDVADGKFRPLERLPGGGDRAEAHAGRVHPGGRRGAHVGKDRQ